MSIVPAVFLDKDGTLIKDIPYNVDPCLVTLEQDALASLRLLDFAGYKLVVVSNQSGVARGLFQERDIVPVVQRLQNLLAMGHIRLSGFYYCPHHPDGVVKAYARECDCRKPKPGMLVMASQRMSIHLPSSWLIGDILDDIEAGNRVFCRTILIDNGHETEWVITPMRKPDFIVKNLLEASQVILG